MTKGEIKIKLPISSEFLQEPLFILSLLTFGLTIARAFTSGSLSNLLYVGALVMGLLATYFVYVYFQEGTKNYRYVGVPGLIFVTSLFLYFSSRYQNIAQLERDYTVLSMAAGVFVLFYALAAHKVLKMRVAIIFAICIMALLTHLPAATHTFLSALDPYWYYKWSDVIVTTGHIPNHDYMTYPMRGGIQKFDPGMEPGLDISGAPLMLPVLMASLSTITGFVGISLHDVAILYAGIFSAFIVLVTYLLVRDLFDDMKPHNYTAGLVAAFMLTFSSAFAQKAIATNAEDDALGMFLFAASLYLLVLSFRKKSPKFLILAGLSFSMLKMSWSGYIYAVIICGIFGVLYAIANYFHKKNCFEHTPYILLAILPSFFTPVIVIGLSSLKSLGIFYPGDHILISLGGMVLVSALLETIRSHRFGPLKIKKKDTMSNIDALVQKNIIPLTVVVLLLAAAAFYQIGISKVFTQISDTIRATKAHDVIRVTIAEQNPMCSTLSNCLSGGSRRFGVAFPFGLFMIPVLLYLGFYKRSFGALFVLTWSIPMIYGIANKSQYIFTASLPIAVLGSTVGLFSIASKKDFESARIIGTILILIVPFSFIPFLGAGNPKQINWTFYQKFSGTTPMHMGPGGDRRYWNDALTWLNEKTDENAAVLTWWDYGHWITSISKRSVLIDNLQADPFQIQDVARFFVNKTTEEDAYETVRAYAEVYKNVTEIFPEGVDLKYVVIDWTMIGKGSALHEIATGDIDNVVIGSFKNYAHCGFLPQASDQNPKISINSEGEASSTQRIIFGCTPVYIQAIIFDITGDSMSISVMDRHGRVIPWKSWLQDNDASILGVQSARQILSCAINYQRLPPNSICGFPTFRNLIYVPEEFSDFMMTRLYLGDYLSEYKAMGLYNREVKPLEHFKLVKEFNGVPDYDGEKDYSSMGFVRIYEIV